MVRGGVSRRDFLRRSAVAAAALGLGSASSLELEEERPVRPKAVSPSDKIVVGFIGCGGMGRANIRYFKEQPDVEIAAVCDVYQPHLEQALALAGGRAKAYHDFRQVLDRKEIDAVVVSTPDHWHALPTILACQAGKDVYVEKPLALTIVEGRRMVEYARRYKRVVQVGTMQRSGKHFQQAVRLVQEGALGKITLVRCWTAGNSYPQGIGNPPDSDPPPGLDWDFWLGPAPYRPYNKNRCIYNFRWFWDYSGGKLTDWGTHLLDIVLWAMGVRAPTAVSASGGKFALQDNRETPDTLYVVYEFPGFVCTYSDQEVNARGIDQQGYGIQFYGTEGTLYVSRSGYWLYPEMREGEEDQRVGRMLAVQRGGSPMNEPHVRNFLDCIRSRERPICDVEVGHYTTTAAHLGNIALWTAQRIVWDAEREQIVNVPEANRYLRREYRKPWSLPS
ncbi:MAG: Gfo/Idh/MocA family oxidoreductase [candidate division KSB1 bacterium]|nr:Gfo/Idh/MocA family oxidoreductase [candidate division KSB1 bacterium]